MTAFAPGSPVWVDLATTDAATSAAFYGDVLGWTATEPAEDLAGYQNFLLDGRRVAGLTPVGGPIWMTHFSTENADASAGLVAEHGGRVLYEPMDVADLGRLAVCEDPQGAPFGLWQPGTHRGAEVVNTPGALAWSEIHTTDVAAATTFYEAVFGWTAQVEPMGEDDYTFFQLRGRGIAGTGATDASPYWLAWFAVADTDATVARASELGGEVEAGPFDVPTVGRTAILRDPLGARFGVLQGETPDE